MENSPHRLLGYTDIFTTLLQVQWLDRQTHPISDCELLCHNVACRPNWWRFTGVLCV